MVTNKKIHAIHNTYCTRFTSYNTKHPLATDYRRSVFDEIISDKLLKLYITNRNTPHITFGSTTCVNLVYVVIASSAASRHQHSNIPSDFSSWSYMYSDAFPKASLATNTSAAKITPPPWPTKTDYSIPTSQSRVTNRCNRKMFDTTPIGKIPPLLRRDSRISKTPHCRHNLRA